MTCPHLPSPKSCDSLLLNQNITHHTHFPQLYIHYWLNFIEKKYQTCDGTYGHKEKK
uniref:Uncharacterized protein n=1 Tax=Anguilla anguilla TaxID=7936 RepID=A0A0E9WNQ5_ANGAN